MERGYIIREQTQIHKDCTGNQQSTTLNIPAVVKNIHYKLNLNKLVRQETESLSLNNIGNVEIMTRQPLLYDSFSKNKKTGSLILIDQVCAEGIIQQHKQINTESEKIPVLIENDRPKTLWLTGLSGSGKSTLAHGLKNKLGGSGIQTYILDGDELREGLNEDLGFGAQDRKENVRRVAEVAKILNNCGITCIAALISPYKADRKQASNIIGASFVEIFVDADIDTCRRRDPKGLYKKVDEGKITGFTGVDSPYERPDIPDITINTEQLSVFEAVEIIIQKINF